MEVNWKLIGVSLIILLQVLTLFFMAYDQTQVSEIRSNQYAIAELIGAEQQTINYINNNCTIINDTNETTTFRCLK